MSINLSSLFWGLLLIGAGVLALAQRMGLVEPFSDTAWMIVFAVISLFGFINYAVSGFREWGWLFPAGIFAGLALTIGLAESSVDSAAVGSPIFFGLLLPFAAAYLTDRAHNWWALIPGGVMLFLGLTTLLVDLTGGEWIGALFMFMVAVSFLAVYLNQRSRTWALIVAYVTGVLGIAPLMASGGDAAAYYGPVFLLAVAIPFFVLYFRSLDRWWAIIPAGVMTVLAVIALLAIAGFIQSERDEVYANSLMMGGLAATFAVLWLRHSIPWARIVTIVLGLLTVTSVFLASYYQFFWPVAIILAGGYLLYNGLRARSA